MSVESDALLNALDGEEASPLHSASEPLIGTVLAVQANYYHVQLDQSLCGSASSSSSPPPASTPPPFLLCTRRSRLKKLGHKVMVGDRVEIVEPDWAGGRGAIAHILPRCSELDRPPVANADQILLVFALAEPNLDPYQLSRFLLKAESTNLKVILCLSKSDLADAETQQQWYQRLRQWGYQPLFISVQKASGLVELGYELAQKITVVAGPSGVGKSSLINSFIPQATLRVGAVSGKLNRGRHTTRHVELFELPNGGLLADTPGFNQPELDCTPEALAVSFPEVVERLQNGRCQFNDCLHREEPNCIVRGDWERYTYYLDLLDEAIVRQSVLSNLKNAEVNLKLKSKRQGQQQYEPKLESKKYRRDSRRSQQQSLQELCEDRDRQLDGE